MELKLEVKIELEIEGKKQEFTADVENRQDIDNILWDVRTAIRKELEDNQNASNRK